MAAMYPVSGAFSVFGARFVSPALGFTLGELFVCVAVEDFSFCLRMELLVTMVSSYTHRSFILLTSLDIFRSLSIRKPVFHGHED